MNEEISKAQLDIRQWETMNKLEKAFYDELNIWCRAGTIQWFRFEPMKLRLAKATFYTPDFGALNRDRTFEFYEVKGFWRDDARVKIKCAAALFPFFTFTAVSKLSRKEGGGWKYEAFQ